MKTNSNLNRYKKIQKRSIPSKTVFKVLSSGFSVKFGVLFFFAIAIFYVFFTPDFKDFKFSEDTPVTEGRITNITGTGNNIGNNEIYKYEFEYTLKGVKYHNASYLPKESKKDTVTIEYLADNPSVSRIKGMTVGVISPGVFL